MLVQQPPEFEVYLFKKELCMYRFLAVVMFGVSGVLFCGCGEDAAKKIDEASKKAKMDADAAAAKLQEAADKTKEAADKGKEAISEAADAAKNAAEAAKARVGTAVDNAKKTAEDAKPEEEEKKDE
jgi:hypothetical protein